MKKILSGLLLSLILTVSAAQDSLKTLSGQQVTEIVKRFHPVAKQADILMEKAKADLTSARGLFDPTLENSNARKTFDGNEYYYYNRPELAVPTWFGIELRAGLEYLSGNRTDPTETRGESSYFGISVPLAKNLLMDKRRAALQTAKIFREASAIEKRNILNNLLQDALKAYWQWVADYQSYRILTEAVKVNEKRVALVKTAFRLGDRPAIDTAEALTQLQSFEVLQSQAWLDFQNAGLELSLYLWTANNQPYYLPETILPADELQQIRSSAFVLPELNALLDDARKNHPELLLYNYKLDALGIEKKLKFQELLPTLNFKYNQLGKGYDIAKTAVAPLFENNFQYGVSMGIPLRLSQGRGEYRKAKLKITETQLSQNQKQLELENKVKSCFNELSALQQQLRIQEQAWINYAALQRGEETRFVAGESSLFLVNARENKALEAFQKLQELKAKYFKATIAIQWAAGLLSGR